MRIALASDHAGVDLKRDIAGWLTANGHDVLDLGVHTYEPSDYPDTAAAIAAIVRDGQVERGIILCGSGAGVSVAANKFPGIRAAVCHDHYTAHQAVEHDDCNVMCLGARVVGAELARDLVRGFIEAEFGGAERHLKRLAKLHDIEMRNFRGGLA